MHGDRDDEICQKALELLSDLCSKGRSAERLLLGFYLLFPRPRQATLFGFRYIGESAVAGGDCLWLGPFWGLSLCLLEALLDTMEGACALSHHQGGPWAHQPHHEPNTLPARSKASSLLCCGPPSTQPP
ncbi:hypothetical protein CesoFtcFv8_000825 [Champsocephalus esox]|uniref:Uncharacterized protein n=1 Tax=Champsocephalus esox TaxID=159716 RepID=A0AAN8D740_9TELE|nr:hypothetical protein CesoFtcFv8_000825 [Champsocephalus esox]